MTMQDQQINLTCSSVSFVEEEGEGEGSKAKCRSVCTLNIVSRVGSVSQSSQPVNIFGFYSSSNFEAKPKPLPSFLPIFMHSILLSSTKP